MPTQPLFLQDTEQYSAHALGVCEAFVLAAGEAPKTPQGAAMPVSAGVILAATVAHAQGGGQPGDRGLLVIHSSSSSSPSAPPLLLHFLTARYATQPGRSPGAIIHYGALLDPASPAGLAALADPQGHANGMGAGEDSSPGPLPGALPAEAAAAALRSLCAAAAAATATASCYLCTGWRQQCAVLHSCGHLLDGAVRRALAGSSSGALVGGKGNHFPGGPPCVEYSGSVPAEELAGFAARVQACVAEIVAEGAETRVLALGDKGEVGAVLAGQQSSCGVSLQALGGLDLHSFPSGRLLRIVAVGGEGNVCPCGGTHVKSVRQLAKLVVGKVTVTKGVTKIAYTCEV